MSLMDFEAAKNSFTTKFSAETLALNERQAAFDPLSPLVAHIVSAAAVSINNRLLFVISLK